MPAPILLLTHSGDYYTIDNVAAAVAARGMTPLRVNTDVFPRDYGLEVTAGASGVSAVLRDRRGTAVNLSTVRAAWSRRLWVANTMDASLSPEFVHHCQRESRLLFADVLACMRTTTFINDPDAQRLAERKVRQLQTAADLGLRIPSTLVSSAPTAARAFYEHHVQQGDAVVTKLLGTLSQTMNATGDFVYTSDVDESDIEEIAALQYAPQIFQPKIPKAQELRVMVVGERVFAGAIDTSTTTRGQTDWRRTEPGADVAWTRAALPRDVAEKACALVRALNLVCGAVDFIVTPEGEHLFLEINPAGEWGWLERDLGFDISGAIADRLVAAAGGTKAPHRRVEAAASPKTTPAGDHKAPAVVTKTVPRPVLIITRSDDNHSIQMVSNALLERGATPIRLDSDRYPLDVQLSGEYSADVCRRVMDTPAGPVDLNAVEAVWYRRFFAGGGLPESLGDMRPASIAESRRSLFGAIANLPCFHLDPYESVRRCDHKELQIRRAAELGLDVPRTLFSNRPQDVRAFYDACDGRVITKMQHSFAIYRGGVENVVFTNPVEEADLEDLSGLRYCPMTWQEMIDKDLELRTTIVGQEAMTASIDSQRVRHQDRPTDLDWRRDGVGLLDDWKPYTLPADVEAKAKLLLAELGLNYGAFDFILTPDGRHVFLEVNAVGEFFWLQRHPGLPIVNNIADVLLGEKPRLPIDLQAWANVTQNGDALAE